MPLKISESSKESWLLSSEMKFKGHRLDFEQVPEHPRASVSSSVMWGSARMYIIVPTAGTQRGFCCPCLLLLDATGWVASPESLVVMHMGGLETNSIP